jgi:galactose mutarotase-like enzyme
MHRTGAGEREGFEVLELVSPQDLVACWVPDAGMVCCSLRHRGQELLGQRDGLRAYVRSGSTLGVPLLHPWANRLRRRGYLAGDARVELPPDAPLVHEDENGLPIHGLAAGLSGWQIREHAADASAARLVVELDLAARGDVMALFPFPHLLRIEAQLRGASLAIDTVVLATGRVPVPIAFGWHPWLRLPDVPRTEWEVELPVRRRMQLDAACLPSGRSEPVEIAPGPLGARSFDDLFVELEPEPTFALAGGGRRVEVAYGAAYRVAVVYAPPDDDVICFEPMTAPTDPFAAGGSALAWVPPGEAFSAAFEIRVAERPARA